MLLKLKNTVPVIPSQSIGYMTSVIRVSAGRREVMEENAEFAANLLNIFFFRCLHFIGFDIKMRKLPAHASLGK